MGEFKICYPKLECCIPNAVLGDPSAVFSCIEVTCVAVFKLLSMVWYVEYLTREMAAPESIRAL